ncbi:MAG: lipid A export permease/ATP-binding protein MsbA [Nitrospinaceae bacterium]|nr:MAG: lipid A export permease/ATP-binding protein MsbA [Nitrospinaceae bacterium]
MSFTLYKRLFQYVRPYLSKLILAIFFSIIVGAIATSPVPLIQKTFDKIFVEKDMFMLTMIPLVLIGLYFIKGWLTYIQNLIIFGISWELVVSVREKLFAHIHRLPFQFFEANETGHLISRIINDVAVMQSTVTRMLKEIMQNGAMAIGLLAWLFYLKWQWAIIAIIIFPVMAFPVSNISRKLKKFSHKGQEILANVNSTILESFSGIKIVRAFNLESIEKDKFNRHSENFLGVMKKNVKYVEIVSPLLEFLGVLSAGVVLWYGGRQVLMGEVSQGTFIAFVVAMFMLYGPLRLLFKIYANIQISLAGAERVFSILDQEEEKSDEGTEILSEFKDRIEFRRVAFRYPSRDSMVLSDIDVVVKKSEVLAIVGMSGAGKTTLVDLLFRFFNVTSGEILIDGKDIREYRIDSLRQKLALVTQETFLFNDTIWNNIAFGKPGASKEEILQAAEAAHVDFFVKVMDDGYETVIGERGVKLSGGQRQRISIARAILRDAPILVLDEATSALDSESEKLVQDALHNLMEHRTTFVIAHRLSTIKHADRIIVLDKGRIAETGTHETLLSGSGLYQKYFEMQMFDVGDVLRDTKEMGEDVI